MPRSPRRLAAVVALVALVAGAAGACGGSDEATPATVPATTAVPATAAPTTTAPTTTLPAPTTSLPPPLPAPSPPIATPGSNKVLVLGDSVTLGAQSTVPRALVGWSVTFDAKENRFINNAVAVLKGHKAAADQAQADDRARVEQAYADAGRLPPPPPPKLTIVDVIGRVAVIHLCTNYAAGGGFASYISAVSAYLADLDRIVWVTCVEWSPGQTEANAAIVAAVAADPRIVAVDWASFSITPGYTYDDGIHLQAPGQAALAELVARAVGGAPQAPPPPPPTTLPPPTTTTTTTTAAMTPVTPPEAVPAP